MLICGYVCNTLHVQCVYTYVYIYAGQAVGDHTTEDPMWDSQQDVGGFQEAAELKPVPFQPPLQMQGGPVHTSQPQHMVQPIPTAVPGTQGQVVDWQQFEAQMNLMCQQNPMFFQQMQQFFWTQAIAAQQQLQQPFQQIHSQQFQHLQQPQQVPAAAAANFNRPFGTTSEYNVVNFSAPQVLDLPDQKGSGPSGAQYISAPSGGLFIPPPMMAHVPHSEETETNQQQTPRPRNAIPIVPPKVPT